MLIPVNGLFFTLLLPLFIVSCQAQQIATPSFYTGDTPYQSQPFNSAEISTAFRVQRDIAMNLTIDQLVWPALDLSTAFFGNDYSANKLSQIEQPLLMGYTRLVLDLYWDPTRSNWQLCPILLNNTTMEQDVIVGNVTCAPRYLFKDFMASINDYLVLTEIGGPASIQTNLITLILNIHNLNSSLSSSETTMVESNLGQIITSSLSRNTFNLAPRIYTPANLTIDRSNINTTATETADTWPQWFYLIQRQAQLLIGFGSIQQQQQNATFEITSFDKSIIFDNTSLTTTMTTSISVNCSSINPSSWSFVNDSQNLFSYNEAYQVTECGYSPYFTHTNYSDSNSTYSAIDSGHLADNVLSTIWSWDTNEPNTSQEANRCAAIQQVNGRWIAFDCAQPLRVACCFNTNPNQWIITNNSFIYDRALMAACPQGYQFDIPRLPQQNIQLRQAMVRANVTNGLIWINLNLMNNEENCWVVGSSGTCWWSQDRNKSNDQFIGLITTSVVSGVIILILVGIFTWIKCARWWRNRKVGPRKHLVKEMLARREYVTVPA